jgi:hypothetical protein
MRVRRSNVRIRIALHAHRATCLNQGPAFAPRAIHFEFEAHASNRKTSIHHD